MFECPFFVSSLTSKVLLWSNFQRKTKMPDLAKRLENGVVSCCVCACVCGLCLCLYVCVCVCLYLSFAAHHTHSTSLKNKSTPSKRQNRYFPNGELSSARITAVPVSAFYGVSPSGNQLHPAGVNRGKPKKFLCSLCSRKGSISDKNSHFVRFCRFLLPSCS